MNSTSTVLVVGATGKLGGQVVDHLLEAGHPVRALARPTSKTSALEAKGVEIARGDMLDLDSLVAAMTGVDAVITTAAGYTKGASDGTDTQGNTNLAEAAKRAGIKRFVLTSILTSDQTPQVGHFWDKKLAEDALEQRGVPFVALRPGAFLDQTIGAAGNPLDKHRFVWVGQSNAPLTFVLASDLARYLAQAVDVDVRDGERIDIGWQQPTTAREVAAALSRISGEDIHLISVPTPVMTAAGKLVARKNPLIGEMAAMFAWFDTGNYIADTTRQAQVFGAPPTLDEALTRLTTQLRH